MFFPLRAIYLPLPTQNNHVTCYSYQRDTNKYRVEYTKSHITDILEKVLSKPFLF